VPAGSFQISLRVDLFHSTRKGTAFQPLLELGVRNCRFPAPLRDDGQIVHILQQFFILRNVQNNGGFPPFFIGQKLNCRVHGLKIASGLAKFKFFWGGAMAPSKFDARPEGLPIKPKR
jgi:hypothetical protein